MTNEDERELQAELARLQQEHRDLDAAIDALHQSPAPDLLRLQRLKKRKLLLRDRIAFIEDQITPDIIARAGIRQRPAAGGPLTGVARLVPVLHSRPRTSQKQSGPGSLHASRGPRGWWKSVQAAHQRRRRRIVPGNSILT